MSTNSLLVKIAEERQLESEAVEEFMLNEDDRDERLKAHYRQGKIVDGKWVNDKEEEEEGNKTKRPLTEWEQDVVRRHAEHERIIALEK